MATPIMPMNNAISAYSNNLGTGTLGNDLGGGIKHGPDDFATLVKGAIEEAARIGRESEQLSMQAIENNADLSQVVAAVAEAEVTLQTVVHVRDKVLESYKEILRMPM